MIRAATTADIPALLELGDVLHQESPRYRHRLFDRNKVAAHFQACIDGAGVLFVATHGERIIGGFCGGIAESWYGGGKTAFDYSFMVHPDYRGGATALRLYRAFEIWAQSMGADVIQVGITTDVRVAQTTRFYHKLGLHDAGVMFEKEI